MNPEQLSTSNCYSSERNLALLILETFQKNICLWLCVEEGKNVKSSLAWEEFELFIIVTMRNSLLLLCKFFWFIGY